MTISVALYILLAVCLLLTAAKYAFGPIPAPHHAKALEKDDTKVGRNLLFLLRGLYVPMSAAFAAVGLMLIALALGPIWSGERWGSLVGTGGALILGVPTSIATWQFERDTGIRGPYRLSAAMTAVSIIAALIA